MVRREIKVLVIYDIFDDKRRKNIVKLLNGYGQRVQMSAFEIMTNKKKYAEFVRKMEELVDINEDSVRIYPIYNQEEIRIFGCEKKTFREEVIII